MPFCTANILLCLTTPGNGLNPRILALIAAIAFPLRGPLELQDAGSFFVGGR